MKPKFSMWDFKPGAQVEADFKCLSYFRNADGYKHSCLFTVESVKRLTKADYRVVAKCHHSEEPDQLHVDSVLQIVQTERSNRSPVVISKPLYAAPEFFPPGTVVETSKLLQGAFGGQQFHTVRAVRGAILLCDLVDCELNTAIGETDHTQFHYSHVERIVKRGHGPVRKVADYDYQIIRPYQWRKQAVPSSYGLYCSPEQLVGRVALKLGLQSSTLRISALADAAFNSGAVRLVRYTESEYSGYLVTANKKRLHRFLRQNANRFRITEKALQRELDLEDAEYHERQHGAADDWF